MTKQDKNKFKIITVNSPKMDFKCDCHCGQKLRIVWVSWRGGKMVDIGVLRNKEKKAKSGVILMEKDIKRLISWLNKH